LSEVVRQRAIGEVAQRSGMSASRIRYYERRGVLKMCSRCDCESIDVCRMFDDGALPIHGQTATRRHRRAAA
jgi:hypothetical protein